MFYSRLALVGIFLLSISTFLVCDARPIKSKTSKSKGAKKSFLNILTDQKSDLNCDDILSDKSDLKTFSDEVAMSFFKTGNVAALDHVLESLVKKKCFTEEETKSFRHQLVTVYELINNDQNKKKRSGDDDQDDDDNNNRRPYSYFDRLNYLVDELIFAYNNGNEDSIDVFKSMVDYILAMEDAKQLKTNQANFLLDKIKDTISQNPRHQHHGDIEYDEKASNDLMAASRD